MKNGRAKGWDAFGLFLIFDFSFKKDESHGALPHPPLKVLFLEKAP